MIPVPATLLYGPRLSSFRRLRCKLQYSRAVRSDMKIYATPDKNRIRVPHPPHAAEQRNSTSILRECLHLCSRQHCSTINSFIEIK